MAPLEDIANMLGRARLENCRRATCVLAHPIGVVVIQVRGGKADWWEGGEDGRRGKNAGKVSDVIGGYGHRGGDEASDGQGEVIGIDGGEAGGGGGSATE